MRLFVAFEIPAAIQSELDRRTLSIRPALPDARWVKPEAMHLTLAFLGEIEPERIPALDRALAEAFAPYPPLELRLAEVGAFPPHGRSRVVWVGVEAERVLWDVQAAVAAAVETTLEIELERRPFHPHLTLARCQPPWARNAVTRLGTVFAGRYPPPFTVSEGYLIASELSPQGTRYQQVGSYPLGGGGMTPGGGG